MIHRLTDNIANPVISIPIGIGGLYQSFIDWSTPLIQYLILICTLIVVLHSAMKILFGKKRKEKHYG